MRLDAIAIGHNPPEDVNVIVEVPIGGEPIKYEMDKAAGTLVVDRFLHTAMRYPGNYGFVPHTLSEDGDPIDVLIANTRPIVPGAVINEHYKDLEPGKWVKVIGWGGAAEARQLIVDAIARATAKDK
jgi:inorganic pyrophosphatase